MTHGLASPAGRWWTIGIGITGGEARATPFAKTGIPVMACLDAVGTGIQGFFPLHFTGQFSRDDARGYGNNGITGQHRQRGNNLP